MKSEKYIVAVSGGVDSVVLLDMVTRASDAKLVVAHFDHGIREDSFEDAVFVKELARKYDLPFELGQAELGGEASEEAGRKARYAFLRKLAKQYQARIVTAHHADDVLETMILNIARGTGWRGLASLRSTPEIARPLLHYRKKQLLEYARQHDLMWREDSTNSQTKYTRNHIRHVVLPLLGRQTQQWLLDMYQKQVAIRAEVEEIAEQFREVMQEERAYRRYPFIVGEGDVVRELLYECIRAETGHGVIRPRLERALLMIKTAQHNTTYQLGDGVALHFTKRHFFVKYTS